MPISPLPCFSRRSSMWELAGGTFSGRFRTPVPSPSLWSNRRGRQLIGDLGEKEKNQLRLCHKLNYIEVGDYFWKEIRQWLEKLGDFFSYAKWPWWSTRIKLYVNKLSWQRKRGILWWKTLPRWASLTQEATVIEVWLWQKEHGTRKWWTTPTHFSLTVAS